MCVFEGKSPPSLSLERRKTKAIKQAAGSTRQHGLAVVQVAAKQLSLWYSIGKKEIVTEIKKEGKGVREFSLSCILSLLQRPPKHKVVCTAAGAVMFRCAA